MIQSFFKEFWSFVRSWNKESDDSYNRLINHPKLYKHWVFIELEAKEAVALKEMAVEMEMSENGVIRQALRLQHLYRAKLKDGQELAWTKNGELVKEEIFGCGGE